MKELPEAGDFAILLIMLSAVVSMIVITVLIIRNARLFQTSREGQQKLIKSYRKIVVLNRQKDYMLGMAAHDLRGPVSNITQVCELILPEIEQKVSKDEFEFLMNVETTSRYLSNMLNDLLDVVQIETGKLSLNKSTVEVDSYLRSIWKMNKLAADKKGIDLRLENETDPIMSLTIDAIKIVQVLNNLISNAIKFSDSGTQVMLRAEQHHSTVRISVKDRARNSAE